jgi:Zn-dependent protease
MLKFALFGIPVRVDGWFWLSTILLGGGAFAHGPEQWTAVGLWTGVVLVSVLVHEFGHALVGRQFGATPFVRLHGFGGVTFLPGARMTRPQNILVSAAGPGAGLLLGLIVLGLGQAFPDRPPLVDEAIKDGLWVNLVWSAVNLLPIQPLDGGQILAQGLGPRRRKAAAVIGFVVAVALSLWTLSIGWIFYALMLAMLAYYNIRREPVEGGVITP